MSRKSSRGKWITVALVLAGVMIGAAVFIYTIFRGQTATDVMLEDSYTIENGKIDFGILDVVYSDGSTGEISDYILYIDGDEFGVRKGKVNAARLEEGSHRMRVVWMEENQAYEYEKNLRIMRSSFDNLENALLEKYGETRISTAEGKQFIQGSGIIAFYRLDLDSDQEDELICLRQKQNESGSVMNGSIYNTQDGESTCVYSLADEGKELYTGKSSEILLIGGTDPYIEISNTENGAALLRMEEGIINPEVKEEQNALRNHTSGCMLHLKENGTKFYVAGGTLK